MKTRTKKTHELSLAEVKDAIHAYLDKHVAIDGEISIEPINQRQEVPGLDPHDCDYIETFNGMKVTVTSDE